MPRHSAPTANWCVEKIEVKVVSGEYIDRTGVVVTVQGSDCKVRACLFVCVCVSVMHAYMHPFIHTHRQTRRQAYKHTYLCGCLQVKLQDGTMTIVPSEDLEAVVAQKVCVAVLALCYGAARSVSLFSASALLSPLRLLVCPDTLPSCSYTACVRHRTRLSSSCPASSKAAQAFTLSSVLSLHLMHHPTNHMKLPIMPMNSMPTSLCISPRPDSIASARPVS